MSVLNKMLRDLEQRQHSGNATLATKPANSIGRDDSRPLWLNVLLLLSAILLLFAVYAILNRPDVAPAQPDATLVVSPDTESVVPELPPAAEQAPVALATEPATMLTKQEQPVALVAMAESSATTADSQPVVGLDVTATTTETAIDVAVSDNNMSAAASPAPAAVKVEIQRPLQTPEQKAVALQQQAVLAAQSGQLMNSISLWQQVQVLAPQQSQAYTSPARLWEQMGQPERAQQILQQGLSKGADSAELRLLLAQHYIQQQQWAAADAVLLPQFDLSLYPEYYGLKATAAQQLGDSVAAQQWFSRLIVLQPQQARWWLGAAIAFDQHGQRQQAQLHYRQALQWGDTLSADSRNYIQQRLAATE